MKITVVVENSVSTKVKQPLLGQHGLAMLIEYAGRKLLFDTAQTDILLHNLSLLGVRPDDIDAVVLSHGHYDHAGGLKALLKHRTKPVDVYVGEHFSAERFSVREGSRSYIGVPHPAVALETAGALFRPVTEPLELWPGLWLSGPIPQTHPLETGVASLVDGKGRPDRFADEIALYAVAKTGLVAVSGCAHRGIMNIVAYGLQVTGAQQVGAIVGGTHLGPAPEAQKAATIEQFLRWQPALVAANHCTGLEMMAELAAKLGKQVFVAAAAGTVLEIPDR